MSLTDHYRKQFAWRDWPRILGALPELRGKAVLDLGCGIGDQAAELAARGARVVGLEAMDDLVREARSRGIPGATFEKADLRALPSFDAPFDGLWGSFVAAYFTDFPAVLATWKSHLAPGGFIALTEIDDLFGHAPVAPRTRELLAAYAQDALTAKRYDFHMGGKLEACLRRAGFTVTSVLSVADREFAFQGPAAADVLDGWRERFDYMTLLRTFCGAEFERMRDDFLACLARTDHRAEGRVVACIAELRV